MSNSFLRFRELMEKYIREEASAAELEELSWRLQSRLYDDEVERMIDKTWKEERMLTPVSETRKQEMIRAILSAESAQPSKGRMRFIYRYRWIAAACLLIIGAVMFTRINSNNTGKKTPPLASADTTGSMIVPGSSRALLTLADGSVITLNDHEVGKIAQQGNAFVTKRDSGSLSYSGASAGISFNTLRTPRGGEYQVVLNDGTQVWLNAATSLRFPVSFIGGERIVELDGEAYFEVAPDPHKPFMVKTPEGSTVEVTGTHFNVMAYNDENAKRTTLLEGSVALRKDKLYRKIVPGQQASIMDNQIKVITMNEPEDAIAWKNGYLSFQDADIKTIMRQAARWYDVDVVYKGEIPERIFTGSLQRSSSLKELLKIFELSDIQFSIQGKTIVVSG